MVAIRVVHPGQAYLGLCVSRTTLPRPFPPTFQLTVKWHPISGHAVVVNYFPRLLLPSMSSLASRIDPPWTLIIVSDPSRPILYTIIAKNAVHQPLEPESDTFQVLYARCKRQMLPPLFARCRVTLTHGISTFAAPSKPSRWFLLPPKFTESSRSYIPHIAQGAFPRRMKGLGVLNKIRAG
jgi:hypothetical protein